MAAEQDGDESDAGDEAWGHGRDTSGECRRMGVAVSTLLGVSQTLQATRILRSI
jgi:hypothetical protein